MLEPREEVSSRQLSQMEVNLGQCLEFSHCEAFG
jgi:hypothetical protein